jgi:CelD/BcsL family acetyltransferase involved in cellulose biosynthesis
MFHRDIVEQFFNAGCLRLSWLEYDSKPLAAEYSFTGGDTIYYYQGGFEPELAGLRPGWLMFAISLRQAIADGYHHYDFLRGDEPYKASWHAQPRSLLQLRIAGRKPSARMRHAAWQTSLAMKRWAQAGWRLSLGRAVDSSDGQGTMQ